MWHVISYLIYMTLWGSLTVSAVSFALFINRKRPKQLSVNEPINMIDGIVLPSPDDPRWHLTDEGHYFCLGSIKISNKEIWYWENGLSATNNHQNVNKYHKAISRQWQSRIAEDSINNAKMPPKVKKIKAIKREEVKTLSPVTTPSPLNTCEIFDPNSFYCYCNGNQHSKNIHSKAVQDYMCLDKDVNESWQYLIKSQAFNSN